MEVKREGRDMALDRIKEKHDQMRKYSLIFERLKVLLKQFVNAFSPCSSSIHKQMVTKNHQ